MSTGSGGDQDRALGNYADLLAKVDASFAGIRARAAAAMTCASGCHQCCLPGLTVNAVEAAHLARHVAARPALHRRLVALAAADPHGGKRCQFLDAAGLCAVYEARPIVCRSHGAPLVLRTAAGDKQKDVCPLNFTGESLDALPADLFLNLELLNTLLALIDSQFRGAPARAVGPRTALTAAALASPGGAPIIAP